MSPDRLDLEAFDVVTEERRLAILGALAARQREAPRDPTLSFADLRERAGVRDSGNFNYHLDRLRDRFVREEEDGYRLTEQGTRMVGTAVAESATVAGRGPARVEGSCTVCDTPLTATYESEVLRVECEAGHAFPTVPVAPRLLAGRDLDEAVDLVARRGHHHLSRLVDGVCFNCEGRVALEPTDADGLQVHFTGACADCGLPVGAPAVHFLADHPAVVAFLHERGVDARERPFWAFDVGPGSFAVRSTDPYRLRVTVREAGDALHLTVDEDCRVVETAVERDVDAGTEADAGPGADPDA